MYILFYISADGPGLDATWSVYRERYETIASPEPIEGSQEFVTRCPDEKSANAEARRRQRMLHA
jgi:hypothetical protein